MNGYDAYLADAQIRDGIAASDPPEVEDDRPDGSHPADARQDTDWAQFLNCVGTDCRWFKGFFLMVEPGGCGYVWSVHRGEPDGEAAICADESRSRAAARKQAEEHAADVADIERSAPAPSFEALGARGFTDEDGSWRESFGGEG